MLIGLQIATLLYVQFVITLTGGDTLSIFECQELNNLYLKFVDGIIEKWEKYTRMNLVIYEFFNYRV
jgi:hypothetical protein